MPFPLSHPAAVLPLRRFCPLRLNLAALVIGSLTPDIPDFLDWDQFSHSFPGSFGFGLPLGFLMLWIFYRVRPSLVATLPNPHRDALLPLCSGSESSLFVSAISLLIGNWTHQAWDFFTHGEAALVRSWGSVTLPFHIGGIDQMKMSRLIYLVSTPGGLLAVTLAYLFFLKRSGRPLFGAVTEWRRYAVWLGILSIPVLPSVLLTLHKYGLTTYSIPYTIRQFAEYYYPGVFLTLALVGMQISRSRRAVSWGRGTTFNK